MTNVGERSTAPTDDAAARWQRAAQLASGVDDDRLKRRRVVVLFIILGVMIASWILGAVLALALPDNLVGSSEDASNGVDLDTTRLVLAGVILLVGYGSGVVGFVWALGGWALHH